MINTKLDNYIHIILYTHKKVKEPNKIDKQTKKETEKACERGLEPNGERLCLCMYNNYI